MIHKRIQKVIEVLGETELNQREIGDGLGVSQNTADKYIAICESRGLIEYRQIGPCKLYKRVIKDAKKKKAR